MNLAPACTLFAPHHSIQKSAWKQKVRCIIATI
jgi:hypothetical protein